MALSNMRWRRLKCSKTDVRLDITLKCGQSFRWKQIEVDGSKCFVGVVRQRLWVLAQNDTELLYHCVNDPDNKGLQEDLADYLQLSVPLDKLYKEWAKVDPVFKKVAVSYPGVRILRQEPTENLFSFICSSNNNIQRISSMVESMCSTYGTSIATLDKLEYKSFPDLEALAKPEVEAKLRELGFGYRAKYIQKSASAVLSQGGEKWLKDLRNLDYKEARESLLKLPGVGPKVSDCILLMSLDQPLAVPVDTHMFQIAANKYLPHLKEYKTVTDKVYTEVGDHFRNLYGEYAGWAHSVLFSADLRHLQDVNAEENSSKETKNKIKKKSTIENKDGAKKSRTK